MKKILEISDSDVGLKVKTDAKYRARTAARAVLIKEKEIALLHVTKHNYYKLPGGGVDEGETIEEGLKRELMEETGCTFKLLGGIGEILEHRSHIEIVQTSHCFLAEVKEIGKPSFEQEEIDDGFELIWVDFNKAIELMKKSNPLTYDGKFIVKRDLQFLEQTKKHFESKSSN